MQEPEQEAEYVPKPGSNASLRKFTWDESARAIGRICMQFQELEECVCDQISELISRDTMLGSIITSELSFRLKVGLLSSLYLYRSGSSETPSDFKTVLGRMHQAEQRRNTILHSYWGNSLESNEALTRYKYTAKSGKGFVHQIEELTQDDIEAIAQEISAVTEDLLSHMATAFPSCSEANLRSDT